MEKELIFLVLLIVASIVTFIVVCLNKKYSEFVMRKSERLHKLFDLNKETRFNSMNQKQYHFYQNCNSKRQLEQLSLHDYFVGLIESEIDYFERIYTPLAQNNINYQNYILKCNRIKTEATEEDCKQWKTTLKRFVAREERIFKKSQIKPILDINIEIKATYTSPAGRNSYSKTINYNFKEFKSIYDHALNLISWKMTRQYQIKLERAKLNDSLRYDVLRRDNFRCQICGASANDGVKLHVDHIIPVSKGGKTEMSNLRTLCDRCNMGKSDKIE